MAFATTSLQGRSDEQRSWDLQLGGAVHRLAHLALVAVGRRRVDVAVAVAECRLDGVAGLVGRRLKDAETERAASRRRC